MGQVKGQEAEQSETTTVNKPRVFVYGTLKRGKSNHGLLAGATYLGTDTVRGPYSMVDLGWYPGVVRLDDSVDSPIVGEVYEVDEPTLHSLDCLEGHPDFYERIKIKTQFKGAWLYTLPPSWLEDHKVLEDGEWHGERD